MKKVFTLFLILHLFFNSRAQDVGVISISSPVTGCSLTNTEQVVVTLFNFGLTDLSAVAFDISFSVNGGGPVTENTSFPVFTSGTSVTYTFTGTTDLSATGSYLIDATSALIGDIDPANDATTGYSVTNYSPSFGGSISGGTNVCIGGNSGSLTLSGNNGVINKWQYSTDGGSTWTDIANTTTSQAYSNVTTTTQYRAEVQNGTCAAANSTTATLTIDPLSVGGSVASNATVCSGANSGTLTLSGHTGSVLYWEYSTDGGVSWTTIANSTTTQSYTNLTTTTRYRAVVKSGACFAEISGFATITVSPVTVGGTLNGSATICSGANSGTLTLTGYTGSIIRWENSTNGGASWTIIPGLTSNTLNYTNYSGPTVIHRVLVQNSPCASMYSTTSTLTVVPATVGGTVTSNATVCSGTNSGTLTLAGNTGTIIRWQYSINGGTTWTNIVNTSNTQSYTNLTTTTLYRAVSQLGTCPTANSSAATITVTSLSAGGTTSPASANACNGANAGTITLAGKNGNVIRWEYSINGGASWTSIANTTTTQPYTNLTTSTQYRAVVQNGTCASANSSVSTISIDPNTIAGIISVADTVCSGSNGATLSLSGNTGVVQNWEYSINGGTSWTIITNTTTSQSYINLTITTAYRSTVKSGTCPAATTSSVTIVVDPLSVGGVTASSATVCSGSNSGTILLNGYTGNILYWESSIDGGISWANIANTTNTEPYLNLIDTTLYRAIVQSGVCQDDTSSIVTLTIDPATVGGSILTSDTVCSGSNAGTLSLSAYTGAIIRWEYSLDGGSTWLLTTNITTTQSYTNITQNTMYRVQVKSGVCNAGYSDTVSIKVDPVSNAGTLASSTSVCSAANSGTVNLSGFSGSIQSWEYSTNGGTTWTTLANTSASQSYNNLTTTTLYRSIVQSGKCPNDTSNAVTITVDAASAGGTTSPVSDTVCSGINNGTVTLSGHTGSVTGWEFSNDNGATWFTISNNTGNTQNYTNLVKTTLYRAFVKSGTCPGVYSSADTIKVDPASNAGTLGTAATVCSGSNTGAITVTGLTGSVLGWENSTNGGVTWNPVAGTSTTQTYTNLSSTTDYRAIIKSGVCANDTSNVVRITVDSVSAGGVTASPATVCAGNNNGTITLSGHRGNVTGWEFSTDNGASWMSLSNTTTTINYVNLAKTTLYRAIVKNGVCNPAYSLADTITVNPVSNAGIILGSSTACEGSNSGSITLNGYTGNVTKWEYSTDGGITWTSIANTTGVQNYFNLTTTTQYRAIVQSGVCAADTSGNVTIIISPRPQALFVANNTCAGNPVTFSNFSSISSGGILLNNWNFGDGNVSFNINPTHTYSAPGTYTVMLIAISDKNCSDTASSVIVVSPLPNAVISSGGPTNVCSGDSVVLFATTGPGLKYLWNTGDTTVSIVVDSTGMYNVIVTDSVTGCFNTDSIQVTIYPVSIVSAGKDSTIKRGSTLMLNGSGAVAYLWTPSVNMNNPLSPTPVVTPTATTVYILLATDANGCNTTDSVKITVSDEYDLDIATIVTPNGDGFNDTWKIRNIELFTNNEVSIFNRYGQEVYQTGSYKNDWNANDLPDGTYYYALKFNDTGKVFKGSITVLREK